MELLIFNPLLKSDPIIAFLIPVNGNIHPILQKSCLIFPFPYCFTANL